VQNDEFSKRLASGRHATAGVTIQRRADELYAVWRELTDLPRFIDDLERIEKLDERRSRWTVRGPAGREYSWEAQIINEEPGRVLAWRTDENADVPHAGSVTFRELAHGRGTEVRAVVQYLPPGGGMGDAFARAMGKDARSLLWIGLLRFRQLMEAGEVAVVTGQPAGDGPRDGEVRRTDPNLGDVAARSGDGAEGRP
jgi:uncharacterized membrane protein